MEKAKRSKEFKKYLNARLDELIEKLDEINEVRAAGDSHE